MTSLTQGFVKLEHQLAASAEIDAFVAEFENMVLEHDRSLRTYTETQLDDMRRKGMEPADA